MSSSHVRVDLLDSIATITLDRPEQRNALFGTMREDLLRAIDDAAARARVIVITGAGGAFCSGGDVGFMAELKRTKDRDGLKALVGLGKRIVSRLRDAPVPTLAAVDGVAAGAGLGLALACDVRVASDRARFGATFGRLGLHPDWGVSYFLPRAVGHAAATELVSTGRLVDAAEALSLGIVSRVIPVSDFPRAVRALAGELAETAPVAARLARRGLARSSATTLDEMLAYEEAAQLVCFDSLDFDEGLRAFLEKRRPRFIGA